MERQEILLKEYEICQRDNNASAQTYWIMAGIFFGIISALIAVLVYGILSNKTLIDLLINFNNNAEEPTKILLGIVISVFGIIGIIILYSILGWLKRVQFLSHRNFERMREIELELGLSKSWRFYTSDLKIPKYYEKLSDKEIWDELKKNMKNDLNTKYSKLLNEKEWSIVKMFKRVHPQLWTQRLKNEIGYEPPSGNWHYKWMIWPLVIISALLTVCGLFTCLYDYISLWSLAIGVIVVICIPLFVRLPIVIHRTFRRSKN